MKNSKWSDILTGILVVLTALILVGGVALWVLSRLFEAFINLLVIVIGGMSI